MRGRGGRPPELGRDSGPAACRFPDWVPLWTVLLLVPRELAVQGFRSLAPCLGVVIRTGRLSKLKLVFQLVAAGTVLAGQGWESMAGPLRWATWVALALALTSGYVSMVTLFWRHADLWTRAPVPMEMR